MDLKERHEIQNLTRHPWELSRCKVISDLLREAGDKKRYILDIGCGDLFLEDYLSRYNSDYQFFCVDIAYTDEEVKALNGSHSNVKVYNTLEAFAAEKQKVDIVLLLDVIEHVEDDVAFLKQLTDSEFVTENTCFLITVPAFQGLYTSHDHFLGHYRRYCLKKLKSVVQEAGLDSQLYGYFYFILLLPRFLKCLQERISGNVKDTTGLVEWKGGIKLTAFLSWVMTTDYKIGRLIHKTGIKLPGLSNYALCRKKRV